MKDLALGLLTALLLALAWTCFALWQQGESEAATIRRLEDVLSATKSLPPTRAERTPASRGDDRPGASPQAPTPDHPSSGSVTVHILPEIAARNLRRGVWRRFGPAIRALHLTSDQTERVINLLMERENTNNDVYAAAQASKLSPPGVQQALRDAALPLNAEIDGVAGPNAAQQLDHSAQVLRATTMLGFNLGADLDSRGLALDPDQTAQLAQAISESESLPSDSDGSPNQDGTVSKRGAAILAKAQGFLSPDQLAVVEASERADFAQERQTQADQAAAAAHP